MKHQVNVVIFDFDGVIIDSGCDIASAAQHTLKHFGQPVLPRSEIIGYVGNGVESLISRSFQDSSEETIRLAIPFYRKYYMENALVETRLYRNVATTLESIKMHMGYKRIALVTNKPEDVAGRILDGLGVTAYFDMVVGPESAKLKPDPEGILQALAKLDSSPEKAIMVGDSHTDIEAGKKAGTLTCGVTYGLGNTEDLIRSSPEILIDDIASLLDYIC